MYLFFNASQQVFSLLEDEGIMGDISNLAVCHDNPFGRYHSPDSRLGEVNSGLWRYDRAYDKMMSDEPSITADGAILPKCLNGVILYADKTGTSVQQRHGLEPVMMTLSLLQEHIRNQTFRAWRPLGYIPDLDQGSKAEKLTNSHPGQQPGSKI
jgi:hypothetical protein